MSAGTSTLCGEPDCNERARYIREIAEEQYRPVCATHATVGDEGPYNMTSHKSLADALT